MSRARGQRALVREGETAPEIDCTTTMGERFVLSQSGKPFTVLYFFPKAFTPGCTRETKLFRDNRVELELAGAGVVGVSTDAHETQCAFAKSVDAGFPLIADPRGDVCRAYGVLWPVFGVPKRVTFVIGKERKVLAVFRHELALQRHRDDVLLFVDHLFRAHHGQG